MDLGRSLLILLVFDIVDSCSMMEMEQLNPGTPKLQPPPPTCLLMYGVKNGAFDPDRN